jgi:RNA polymerase sigma factor (sigma-70 family)
MNGKLEVHLGSGDYLDENTRKELDSADWEEILPRLLQYTRWQIKKHKWLGSISLDPEEFVQETIARAYGVGSGGALRKWNQERCPDLADFLIGVIRSLTSHEIEHLSKFRHESFGSQVEEKGTRDPIEIEASLAHEITSRTKNPEEAAAQEELARGVAEEAYRLTESDDEGQMVLMCILDDGITKPKEIAEEIGYEVEKVYNIMKRLRRRLADLFASKR